MARAFPQFPGFLQSRASALFIPFVAFLTLGGTPCNPILALCLAWSPLSQLPGARCKAAVNTRGHPTPYLIFGLLLKSWPSESLSLLAASCSCSCFLFKLRYCLCQPFWGGEWWGEIAGGIRSFLVWTPRVIPLLELLLSWASEYWLSNF